MYSVIQSQSTKKIDPLDVMKFPWEKEKEEKTIVTKEQREELIKKSKEIEKKLNNNG